MAEAKLGPVIFTVTVRRTEVKSMDSYTHTLTNKCLHVYIDTHIGHTVRPYRV